MRDHVDWVALTDTDEFVTLGAKTLLSLIQEAESNRSAWILMPEIDRNGELLVKRPGKAIFNLTSQTFPDTHRGYGRKFVRNISVLGLIHTRFPK